MTERFLRNESSSNRACGQFRYQVSENETDQVFLGEQPVLKFPDVLNLPDLERWFLSIREF
jgi:hypothetical protein